MSEDEQLAAAVAASMETTSSSPSKPIPENDNPLGESW